MLPSSCIPSVREALRKWNILRKLRNSTFGHRQQKKVRLMLMMKVEGGHAYETVKMELGEDGTWATVVNKNLLNKFYTFNVKINDKW